MLESEFKSLSRGDMVWIDEFPPAYIQSAYFQGGQFRVDAEIARGLTIPGLTFDDTIGHNWKVVPNSQNYLAEGWDG